MDKTFKKIGDIIDTYESGIYVSTETLVEMQRELSCCHYHLTTLNIEAGQEYNKEMYNFNGSVAAGKIYAENKVPMLRKTRKLLESIKQVLIAMGSELKTN